MDADAVSCSKVETFVLLAKGARGKALVDLIGKATSDPGIFGFGELLACPNIDELRNSEFAPFHELLQLFAYGTWPDFQARSASLPALNEAQQLKLKQLTVVSLALNEKVIPYATLQEQLGIATLRELEDFLITQCFYTSLLKAKLNQATRCLLIRNVIGRDVRPADLPDVNSKLSAWIATAEDLLKAIEQRITASNAAAEAAKTRREELEQRQEEVRKAIKLDSRTEGMLLDETFDLMDDDRSERELVRGERSERVRPKSRRR